MWTGPHHQLVLAQVDGRAGGRTSWRVVHAGQRPPVLNTHIRALTTPAALTLEVLKRPRQRNYLLRSAREQGASRGGPNQTGRGEGRERGIQSVGREGGVGGWMDEEGGGKNLGEIGWRKGFCVYVWFVCL